MNTPDDDRAALQAQAQDWLVRLTSGRATTVDAQDFKRWCAQSPLHAQVMAEMTRVWDVARPAAEAVAQRMRAAQPPRAAVIARAQPNRRYILGAALAAGAAAFVVVRPPGRLWPALSDMTADYSTGTGEQRQVVLADAAVVEMNTQTSFNLSRAAEGEAATLDLLNGEAQVLLDASRAAPFTMTVGGGRLVASAASRFNVRATGPEVCVTCMAGSVELNYGGRVLVAKEAQQISYGQRGAQVARAPDLSTVNAWRDRVLVFNDTPLAAVVEEINRYRPGRLIVTNAELGRRKVQARLRLEQLARIETLIGASYGAKVTTLPAGIVLLG
ncbi:FecR family protein [Variovorax sp. GB1P17]|uniref:FecR family protein n=1 Tax=Variovorax sp. GB1P17 TaxID=3443740 RepID=UPI003F4625C1